MRELNEVERSWEQYLQDFGDGLKEVWYKSFYKIYSQILDPVDKDHIETLKFVHLTFFNQMFYEFLIENDHPLKKTYSVGSKKSNWIYDEDDDSYENTYNPINEDFEGIISHFYSYPLFAEYVPIDYDPYEEAAKRIEARQNK